MQQKRDEPIGAAEMQTEEPSRPVSPTETPPERPDHVEGFSRKVGLVVTILSAISLLGGAVGAVSSVNSHFSMLDTSVANNSRRLDRQSEKFTRMDSGQSDHERVEHSHYDELLRHLTATETDVKWIIKRLK